MLVCDKCGERIPDGANLCPRCADPVTAADSGAADASSEATTIQIEFGHSSSPRFADAEALACRIPSYQIVEGPSPIHQVTLRGEDVGLALSLWELVGNWKNSRMSINGERATKKDLTYGAFGCYQKRQQSFRPTQYCLGEEQFDQNIWGCHRLGIGLNAWRGGWLTWGRFDSEGRWHWDRDRISHELEKGLHEFRFCPVLEASAARQVLAELPDGIHPPSSRSWNYVKEWQDRGEVPIGVCPTLQTAIKLAASGERPDWKNNESLERTDSKLEKYDDHTVALNVSREERAHSSQSGCLSTVLLFAVAPTLALLLASLLG